LSFAGSRHRKMASPALRKASPDRVAPLKAGKTPGKTQNKAANAVKKSNQGSHEAPKKDFGNGLKATSVGDCR
jgi:hypothetical protein